MPYMPFFLAPKPQGLDDSLVAVEIFELLSRLAPKGIAAGILSAIEFTTTVVIPETHPG